MLRTAQTASNTARKLKGIIAATFTPFTKSGDVDLDKIPRYADYLHKGGVKGVFVCGTTGEGPSLSLNERKTVAEEWMARANGKLEHVIVQVGAASVKDAKYLAAHANQLGVYGIGCVPPFFMKNIPLDGIVQFLRDVAACCPNLPFYYYHFPAMTSVNYNATAIMAAAGAVIPNLAGLKFTSHDLKDACAVANLEGGRFQVIGGFDDLYLARLSLGIGDACIGAFYNFMPRVAIRLEEAYQRNDMDAARVEQWRLQQIASINQAYSTGLTCREFMDFIGLDLGPPRVPLAPVLDQRKNAMRKDLEDIGFFDWSQ